MKEIDKIISKIGADKILHFCVGALIYAIMCIITFGNESFTKGEYGIFLAFYNLFVFVIALLKEFNDEKIDWFDILATVLGSISITILFVLKIYI